MGLPQRVPDPGLDCSSGAELTDYRHRFIMEAALTSQATARDHAPFLENVFFVDSIEQNSLIKETTGRGPKFLAGTYYINGPAGFDREHFGRRHWLDGDGMVSCLRFDNGTIRFVSKFVRTTKFVEELKAQRPLFRTFGTSFPDDRLRFGIALESSANVSVYRYQNVLLAFGEQGLP